MRSIEDFNAGKAARHTCHVTADQPRLQCALKDGRVRLQLPGDLGNCYTESIELEPGLILSRLHYHAIRPLVEYSNGPHVGRVMVVTIGLRGESRYRGSDSSSLLFKEGYTTISTFRPLKGERHYDADTPVSQLRLVINEMALTKYAGQERAEKMLNGNGVHKLGFMKSSTATQAHAAALSRYMTSSTLTQDRTPNILNLNIHALSLLAEQLNLLLPSMPDESPHVGIDDIQRMERAHDIMKENMHQPLTIDYLATTVGMSASKLKKGFRQLYNNTPMGVLFEMRMRKAYTFLESGKQVSQVAWSVGYKYPNNFSVAFSRYFGRSPKSVFGSRKR